MKNSIYEMKNALEITGNRADHREERISEIKDRSLEVIPVEEREVHTLKMRKFYESYLTFLGRATE